MTIQYAKIVLCKPTGDTAHSIVINDGAANFAWLGPGALGTLLTSKGASADPAWLAAPPCGFNNSTTANSAAITTTEAIVAQTKAIPANTLVVGTAFRFSGQLTCTTSAANSISWRLRYGTAGTTSDAQIAAVGVAAAATGTNISFSIEILCVVTATGATGTPKADLRYINAGTTGISTVQIFYSTVPASSTLDTTLSNAFMSLSIQSSAATSSVTAIAPMLSEMVKL